MLYKLFSVLLGVFCASITFAQTFTSSNLPIIVIETNGVVIADEPKRNVVMGIVDNGPNKRNNLTDSFNAYRGKVGIELRGSTSQQLSPKKPYGIETRDSTGNGISVSLLGMPAEEDWVLLAPYSDKSLMRDVLTYAVARKFSKVFVPRTRFCELVIDGQYQGVYVLMEKIKRDKNRVDISSLKTTDNTGDAVTGGYLLKIDKISGSPSRIWNSPYINLPIQIDYPKIEDITEPQFSYIKNYFTEFEASLRNTDFLDDTKGYRKYVDLESFVDYFLMNEFTKNVDGYRLSTYFYKNRDSKSSKIVMGPLWDFNLAFGNADYYSGYRSSDWQYRLNQPLNDTYRIPFWWEQLMKDSVFVNRIKVKWKTLRPTVFNNDILNRYIDSTATVLDEAQTRNFQRWNILGLKVWPNFFVGNSYQAELDLMKGWIKERLVWLDENISNLTTITALDAPIDSRTVMQLSPNPSAQDLTIAYEVPRAGKVEFVIYDLTGRAIQQWGEAYQSQGSHRLIKSNEELTKGIYIIVYAIDGVVISRQRWCRL